MIYQENKPCMLIVNIVKFYWFLIQIIKNHFAKLRWFFVVLMFTHYTLNDHLTLD